MPKGYRTDVLAKPKFQEEVAQRKGGPKPETVACPEPGCACTYEMYGYKPATLAENVAKLKERVKKEHPGHTSEVLAVNEFRRPR